MPAWLEYAFAAVAIGLLTACNHWLFGLLERARARELDQLHTIELQARLIEKQRHRARDLGWPEDPE